MIAPDQRQVGVVDDHAIGGIAGQRRLDRVVEGGRESVADRLRRGVGRRLRAGCAVLPARKLMFCAPAATRRLRSVVAAAAAAVAAAGAPASVPVKARASLPPIDTATRSLCVEGRGRPSGTGRAAPPARKVLTSKVKPGRPGDLVEIAGARAADREILDRHVEQLRQRVDIVGAAREAPGRVELLELRAGPRRGERGCRGSAKSHYCRRHSCRRTRRCGRCAVPRPARRRSSAVAASSAPANKR